jgi:hypothetical protein
VFDAFESEEFEGSGFHHPIAQTLFLSSSLKTGYPYFLTAKCCPIMAWLP